MLFIYILRPARPEMLTAGPTAEESAIVSQHFAYLEALTAGRTVLLAGRTADADDSTFGIVILRALDEEAARRLMNEDPAVRHGVMSAVLHPFRVALRADRWDDDSTGLEEGARE